MICNSHARNVNNYIRKAYKQFVITMIFAT